MENIAKYRNAKKCVLFTYNLITIRKNYDLLFAFADASAINQTKVMSNVCTTPRRTARCRECGKSKFSTRKLRRN